MKNRLKRGILAGSLAAALALGCGLDSSKAVGPEIDNSGTRIEQASDRIRKQISYNPQLEEKIENALDKIRYGNRSSAKPAQIEALQIPYGGFSGDLDFDHDVDFDDFFNFADQFGVKYDFDDFFNFADQFGKQVNVIPRVNDLTLDKNNADTGEEVLFTGFAHDIDGDNLRYSWLVNGNEIEVNGGELRREFSNPGEYRIGVRVTDDLGAQSNELVRTLMVESKGPKLSLPSEISFDQYVSGDSTGNVFRLNLDDFVSDLRFSDSQLTWTVDDNSVDNNQFTFWPRESFWHSYTEKALHLDKDGNELVINPVANFSGSRYVNFTVTNPDGRRDSKRVKVDVVRTPEFDDWYNDVVTGGGWDNPPKSFYIWTGNGRSQDSEWPLSEGKGPLPTPEEISHFERVAQMIPQVSNFFDPLEIRYTNSWDEWLANRDEGAILTYIDNSGLNGGTTPYLGQSFTYKLIGVNSKDRTDKFFPITLHELFDHGVGMDHPENDRQELFSTTIFSGGNRLDYIPNRDKAVIDSFYETRQY